MGNFKSTHVSFCNPYARRNSPSAAGGDAAAMQKSTSGLKCKLACADTKNAVEAEKNALSPAPEPEVAEDEAEDEEEEEEEEEEEAEPVEWKDPRDPAHWGEDDEDHDAYHDGVAAAQDSGTSEQTDTEAPADEEDPDEVGRRIAAQWTSNPEAVGPKEGAKKQDEAPSASNAGQQCDADGDQQCSNPLVEDASQPVDASKEGQKAGFLDSVRSMVGGLFSKNASAADAPQPEASEEQKRREDVERRLRAAEDAWRAENDILGDAERRLSDLQTKLKRDHGPDGLFSYLDGSCYDWSDTKYKYTVCGFGQATQKEGGSSTSLGSFSGFEEHHTVMVFTGGAVCWQGPARSLRVELKCSASTQLLSVAEPNRCQYTSTLLTPAACSPEIVSALKAEVAELESAVSG